MTLPVSAVIQELRRIPRATWIESDPTKPPIILPRDPPEVGPAGYESVFDDTDFALPDSPQWNEAVNRVGRRVSPGGEGLSYHHPVGIEALAWYASFHGNSERWGIYVPLSSLPIMDSLFLSHLPLPRPERWRLAWEVLMAHETVHFAVDYACAWFELLYHTPVRRAFSDRMGSDLASGLFPNRSGYLEIEETLANGNVLRELAGRVVPDIEDTLRQFIRGQPTGYRDGELAESDAGFAVTAAETLRSYLAVWSSGWNIDHGNPALDLTRLLPLRADAHGQCQIWIINDLEAAGLSRDGVRQITCVRPIEETRPFSKALLRLHPELQGAWMRLKDRLSVGIPNGSDFKKWKADGVWSVRVSDGFRAHLQQPPRGQSNQPWLAIEIGNHKKLGHG